MSTSPTVPALQKVIRSHKEPVSVDELIRETTELLESEGNQATYESIFNAINQASESGANAVLDRQPDGTLQFPIEPPPLLALSEELAIPLVAAQASHIQAHCEYVNRLGALWARALKTGNFSF